jgi:hypothetical protein
LLAAIAASAALPARADVDFTGFVSLGTQVTKQITSLSPEGKAGCLGIGNHTIVPINVAVANVGTTSWSTDTAPAPVCYFCPCPTAPTQGVYTWSNTSCQWQFSNFVDFIVTDASDVPPVWPSNPAIAKSQCIDNFSPSVGPWRCLAGSQEGQDAGFTGSTQVSTTCRFVNMDQLPANGSFRFSVTVNQAAAVAEDSMANNVIVGAFNVTNGQASSSAPSWQPAETIGTSIGNRARPMATASLLPHHVHTIYGDNGAVKVEQKFFGHWDGVLTLDTSVMTDDAPAAVSWGPNRIDVFVRGRDGQLQQTYTADGGFTWGQWYHPVGTVPMAGPPAVASWGSGRLDVVYLTTSGQIAHVYYGGGWGHEEWTTPGPVSGTYTPAIVARGNSKLTIAVKDSLGNVYMKSYNPGWTGFDAVANTACSGSLSMTAINANEVVMACRNVTSLQVTRKLINGAATILNPTGLPSVSSDPAVTGWMQGASSRQWDVFYTSSDLKLYDARSTNLGSSWSSTVAATGTNPNSNPRPAPISWGVGRIDVAYDASSTAVGLVSFY